VSLNPQKVCVRSDFFTETVLYICVSHLINWGNVFALSFQNYTRESDVLTIMLSHLMSVYYCSGAVIITTRVATMYKFCRVCVRPFVRLGTGVCPGFFALPLPPQNPPSPPTHTPAAV